MNDERIIKMYEQGFTIDYITKIYHKYKNRNLKPVTINGTTLFPVKIYKKSDCRLYVIETIYKYLIDKDVVSAQTQTAFYLGRGAV